MKDWDRYAAERDTAAYKAMGTLTALLKCGAIKEVHIPSAQAIVNDYNHANTLLEQARLAEIAALQGKAKEVS